MTDGAGLSDIEAADRSKVTRYLRYAALSLDRVCGNLLELSSRLEAANFIPADRKTKKLRDAQLRRHNRELSADPYFVAEMVEKLAGHPDPEAIVASLFRDLELPDAKRAVVAKARQPDE
jgi:hypothetical protein